MVPADRRHDTGTTGVGAGDLEGQVDRFTAADPEHHAGQQTIGAGRQPLGQQGSPAGDQMMIADVEVIHRSPHGGDHRRVAMAEIEHAPVAVAVVEPASVERVAESRPAALAHHEIQSERLVGGHLAGVDVSGERRSGGLRARIGLPTWRRLGHEALRSESRLGPSGRWARWLRTRQ